MRLEPDGLTQQDHQSEEALLKLAFFVYNNRKDKLGKSFSEWYETEAIGWSFYPICKNNKLVAVVLSKENEVHVSIDLEYKGRWLDRRAIKDILGSIIEEYGSVKTYVDFDCDESAHFVERLGFQADTINYVMYELKNKSKQLINDEGFNKANTRLAKVNGDLIQKLFTVEEEMLKHPQADVPKTHYLANGLYAREIFIPKGTLIIGKMHKFSQINTVSKGDISVLTENGWKRMKAPHTFESPAGIKRAGYAHRDTIWTTFVATEETDIKKMDEVLTIESYQDYINNKDLLEDKKCHLQQLQQ